MSTLSIYVSLKRETKTEMSNGLIMQTKMDYVMWRLNLVICFGNSCDVFEQFRILKLGIDVPEAEHRSEREALQESRMPEAHTG